MNTSDKEKNEAIFKELSLAYEILNDPSQKTEYDSMRSQSQYYESSRRQQQHYQQQYQQQQQQYYQQQQQYEQQQQQYNHQSNTRRNVRNEQRDNNYQQHQQYNTYDDSYRNFEDWMQQAVYESERNMYNSEYVDPFSMGNMGGYQPIIVGSIIPAGQIILPYSIILLSTDSSHFALLDGHCSIGVYKGDVNLFMSQLSLSDTPDLTTIPVELKFKTEGKSSLRGNCFAGLDSNGILAIYKGHPGRADYSKIIWSSKNNAPPNYQSSSFFDKYFLELSPNGELAIRVMEIGGSESRCVWSTTMCNSYIVILRNIKGQIVKSLLEFSNEFREQLEPIRLVINDVYSSEIITSIRKTILKVFNMIVYHLTEFMNKLMGTDFDAFNIDNNRKSKRYTNRQKR